MPKFGFHIALLKKLVTLILGKMHVAENDCLGRFHLFLNFGNFYCQITLLDTRFIGGGLFLELYERVDSARRVKIPLWQMPSRARAVIPQHLSHLFQKPGVNDALIRLAAQVVKFGKKISEREFVKFQNPI